MGLDKYTNRTDKKVEGHHCKKVLEGRAKNKPFEDSKQRGKVKAPLAPASSSPKAGSKAQAQKQVSEKKPSKLGKFTERSSIKKSPSQPKQPPSKGR